MPVKEPSVVYRELFGAEGIAQIPVRPDGSATETTDIWNPVKSEARETAQDMWDRLGTTQTAQTAIDTRLTNTEATAIAYATRAAFLAATIPAPVAVVSWLSNGQRLSVQRDATGTIAQTDGTKWKPLGDVTPDHWSDTTATDASTGAQSAIDYIATLGGGVLRLLPHRIYNFGSSVIVSTSNTVIDATGAIITADATLGPEVQNVPDGIFNFIGQLKASKNLASDAAEGATSVVVDSASAIATGDIIRLYNFGGGSGYRWYTVAGDVSYRHFISRVTGISGTTITLSDPLPFDFDATTYSCVVSVWEGLKNCAIRGGIWDGGGYDHALTNGKGTALAYSKYCQDLSIQPEEVRGFSGAAVYPTYTFGFKFTCTYMEGHRDGYADPIVEDTNSGFYGVFMSDCRHCVVGDFTANRIRHVTDGARTSDVVVSNIIATNSHRPPFGSHLGCDKWQHTNLSTRGLNGGILWRGFNCTVDGMYLDSPNDAEPAFYDALGAVGDLKRSYTLANINSNMGRESIRLEADIDTCIIEGGHHKGGNEDPAYSVIVVNSPRMKTLQINGGVIEGPVNRLVDLASGATERVSVSFHGTEFRDYTTSAVRCEAVSGATSLVASGVFFAPNGGTDHIDANGTYDHLSRKGFVKAGSVYEPDNQGTFTPTVGDGTNNCTLDATASLCHWRKDGNRVIISGEVRLTAKGSASGAILLGNLPFTINSSGGGNITYSVGLGATTNTGVKLRALNGTSMNFFKEATNGLDTVFTDADLTNTSRMLFSATYTTND